MKNLLAFIQDGVIPHQGNNHHPHFIRLPYQAFWVILIFTLVVTSNVLFSSKPKVLGFSTNIDVAKIIQLTNKEREKVGLKALKENPILDQGAVNKGKDMIEKGYWSHFALDGTTPWYFFGKAGYRYSVAGENLARDFSTNEAVVSAWMDSPTHRENILNSEYTDIGIGVIYGKLEGRETSIIVQFLGSPAVSGIDSEKTLAPQVPEITLGLDTKIKDLGVTQKMLIPILLFLAFLYLIDSVIIHRKKIYRAKSHSSLLHFSALIILIVSIVLVSKGGIL